MRVTRIEYAVTLSEDYNNYRCGVVVELNEGESEVEAVDRAREFCNRQVGRDVIPDYQIQRAQRVIAQAEQVDPKELADAKALLEKLTAPREPF